MPSPPLPTRMSFSIHSSPTSKSAEYFGNSLDDSLQCIRDAREQREHRRKEREEQRSQDERALSDIGISDDGAVPDAIESVVVVPKLKVQAPSASPHYSLRQMSSNELLREEQRMVESKSARIDEDVKKEIELEEAKRLREEARQARLREAQDILRTKSASSEVESVTIPVDQSANALAAQPQQTDQEAVAAPAFTAPTPSLTPSTTSQPSTSVRVVMQPGLLKKFSLKKAPAPSSPQPPPPTQAHISKPSSIAAPPSPLITPKVFELPDAPEAKSPLIAPRPASPTKQSRVEAIRQRFEDYRPKSPAHASVRRLDADGNSFTFDYHPVSPITEVTEVSSLMTKRSSATNVTSAARSALDRHDSLPRSMHSRTGSLPSMLVKQAFDPIQEEVLSPPSSANRAPFDKANPFSAFATSPVKSVFANRPVTNRSHSSDRTAVSSWSAEDASILHEGNVVVPKHAGADLSSRGLEWTPRYAVLTASSFEFRPTDLSLHDTGPIVAFRVRDCARVVDKAAYERFDDDGFYPFAVDLKDDSRKVFAAKTRKDRVNWTSQIEDQIAQLSKAGGAAASISSPVKVSPAAHIVRQVVADDAASEQSSLFGHSKGRSRSASPTKSSTFPAFRDMFEPNSTIGMSQPGHPASPVKLHSMASQLPSSPRSSSSQRPVLPRPPTFFASPDAVLTLFPQEMPELPPKLTPHKCKSLSEVGTTSAVSVKSSFGQVIDAARPALLELLQSVQQRQNACVLTSHNDHEDVASLDAALLAQSNEIIKMIQSSPVRAIDAFDKEEHRSLLAKLQHIESLLRTSVKSKVSAADGVGWIKWQLKLFLDVENELRAILNLHDDPMPTSAAETFKRAGSKPSLRHPSPQRPFAMSGIVTVGDVAPAPPPSPASTIKTVSLRGQDAKRVFAGSSPREMDTASDRTRTRRRTSSLVSKRSLVALEELVGTLSRDLERQAAYRDETKASQDVALSFMQALYKDLIVEREERAKERAELSAQLLALQTATLAVPSRILETLGAADTAPQTDKCSASTSTGAGRLSGETISKLATLERKLSGTDASKLKKDGSAKDKGPRMPRTRIWGAPEPATDRKVHFGSVKRSSSAKKGRSSDAAGSKGEDKKGGEKAEEKSALADAISNDPALTKALENLATGGDINDAATLSLAIYEILALMREQKTKIEEEEKRKKDKEQNGLSKEEEAELEVKRAEVERIRQAAKAEAAANSQLNALVNKLTEKSEAHEALLRAVVDEVKSPRHQTLDPKLTADLSDATKSLLGQVKNGVDSHVKDFRAQLTSEVQRMFKEVARLKDQRKALELEVSELLAFRAKQGGASASAGAGGSTERKPAPTAADATGGFFGPRLPK